MLPKQKLRTASHDCKLCVKFAESTEFATFSGFLCFWCCEWRAGPLVFRMDVHRYRKFLIKNGKMRNKFSSCPIFSLVSFVIFCALCRRHSAKNSDEHHRYRMICMRIGQMTRQKPKTVRRESATFCSILVSYCE